MSVENEPKYTDDEWGLLVGLPQSVMVAASQAEHDGTRKTVAEWQAGITAIRDGRDSSSTLVRTVADEVVDRIGVEEGGLPPVFEYPDRDAGLADVIARAGTAHTLLVDKAAHADAEAYRYWVVTVADQVIGAAKSGDFLGIGGDVISDNERVFRDQLAAALEI